jgi:hypothetical protein
MMLPLKRQNVWRGLLLEEREERKAVAQGYHQAQ